MCPNGRNNFIVLYGSIVSADDLVTHNQGISSHDIYQAYME